MKKIKRKIISCIGCGKEIEVLITSNRKYCSIKCHTIKKVKKEMIEELFSSLREMVM